MIGRLVRSGGAGLDMTRLVARVALVVVGVGGCASTHEMAGAAAIIAPDVRFVIPSPGELGRWVDMAQQITARYGDRTLVFEGRLYASPEQVRLVALDAFGRRALGLSWDGVNLSFDSVRGPADVIEPENVLADIAIVYWPEQAVRRGLTGSGASFHASYLERSISSRDGRNIATVAYARTSDLSWPIWAKYRNIPLGYELDLRSAAVEQ